MFDDARREESEDNDQDGDEAEDEEGYDAGPSSLRLVAVVDVSEFLSRYKSDVRSQSDLMLLWSVLLAGIEVRYHAPLVLRPFFYFMAPSTVLNSY